MNNAPDSVPDSTPDDVPGAATDIALPATTLMSDEDFEALEEILSSDVVPEDCMDLEMLDGYLAGLGLDTGWLVIFDRRSGQAPIAERTASSTVTSPAGRAIQVVRA